MPKRDDFQALIDEVTTGLHKDLAAMKVAVRSLPELPGNAEYLQLQGFGNKDLARLMLNVIVDDRTEAVAVTEMLTPLPLAFSPSAPFFFRPLASLSMLEKINMGYASIFPVYFFSQWLNEEPHHISQFVWYYQPKPDNPALRLFVVAHLRTDNAKLYAAEAIGFPSMPPGILIAQPPSEELITRTATVHWPVTTTAADWQADLIDTNKEDEWATELEEKTEYEN